MNWAKDLHSLFSSGSTPEKFISKKWKEEEEERKAEALNWCQTNIFTKEVFTKIWEAASVLWSI